MSRKTQLVIDSSHLQAASAMLTAHPNLQVLKVDLPRTVYQTLHGHVDVFAAVLSEGLVAEPRLYDQLLRLGARRVIRGERIVGEKYPETAAYNALITGTDILHCAKYTDAVIKDKTSGLRRLDTRQGYSRCTTLALTGQDFLTSDRGIEKLLLEQGYAVLFVDGAKIHLKGQVQGFIGGAMGMEGEGRLWVYGQLETLEEALTIRTWCHRLGIEIIEMKKGSLEDIGGLLFWET